MHGRWVERRAHSRRLKDGRIVQVAACYVWRPTLGATEARVAHPCPVCGAPIDTRAMPGGGRAHFETGPGLSHIKHPCLHLGEGVSRRRPRDMRDLFDTDEDARSRAARPFGT